MPETINQPPKRSGIFQVLWRGMVVFILLIIGLEGFARLPVIQNKVPIKSFGFSNSLFEIKWAKLNQYIQQNGVPDVIIVGNSMVNTGIDPLVMEKQIQESTGKSLSIFNFGVEGLNLSAVSELARLLIQTWHPKIVLLGTDIRDYSLRLDQGATQEFLNTPWLKYRLGSFTVSGWTTNQSMAVQDFLLARNWYMPDFDSQIQTVLQRFNDTNVAGYELDRHVPAVNFQNPDPTNAADKMLFDIFKNYTYEPSRLELLASLVTFADQNGCRLIFLEMPLQKTMYQFFDRPDQTRDEFLGLIRPIIQQAGGELIESPIYVDIPDADWGNRTHLNLNGAPIFSKFLADRLVQFSEIKTLLK